MIMGIKVLGLNGGTRVNHLCTPVLTSPSAPSVRYILARTLRKKATGLFDREQGSWTLRAESVKGTGGERQLWDVWEIDDEAERSVSSERG